jgi:signal transduction histidine kinase
LQTPVAPRPASTLPYPLQVGTLAALYVALGWAGVRLASHHEMVTLIWLPGALSLAALVLHGRRLWPGVLIGSLVLNVPLALRHPVGLPDAAWVALAVAIGNTLEAVVGSWLMVDRFGFRPDLARIRDVMLLVVFGGAFATMISAAIGVTALWLGGDVPSERFLFVARLWWLGAFGGVVTLTPALFLLRHGSPAWRSLVRNPELWGVASLIIASGSIAFGGFASIEAQRLAMQIPLPCMVWAGVRLGTRGAVAVSVPTIVGAALATANGRGPLAAADLHVSMTLLWTYAVGLAFAVLTLAAAVAQRDRYEEQRRREAVERERIEREHLLNDERERVMREMHDGLGGQLVSVLSMVQRGQATEAEIGEGLRRALDDMRIMIDSLEVRKSSFVDLFGKLRARLDPLLRRNGVRAHWRVDDLRDLSALSPEESLHCIRVIQEATSNVIQHASAANLEIRVFRADGPPDRMVIEVRDDGVGLPPGRARDGRGTRNMISRADALGAELVFETTEPGRCVRLVIPMAGRAGELG